MRHPIGDWPSSLYLRVSSWWMVERLGAIWNGGSCINIISSESLDVGMFLPPHYTPSFGCIRCSSDGWALVLASDSQVCKQCGDRSSHKPSASHLLWSGIEAGWLAGVGLCMAGTSNSLSRAKADCIPPGNLKLHFQWPAPVLPGWKGTWFRAHGGRFKLSLEGNIRRSCTRCGSRLPWKEKYLTRGKSEYSFSKDWVGE